MTCRWVGSLVMSAMLLTSALAAQGSAKPRKPDRPHRSGLWAELAAGPGFLSVAHAGDDQPLNSNGEGGFLRLGGVISDNVLLAWESAGFNNESFFFGDEDSTAIAEVASVGVTVLWFPGRTGLFLKGGVGLASGSFTVQTSATQADTVEGTGIGLTFGAGWDISFHRKYAITVGLAAFVTAIGDLALPSRRVDDVIGTIYQLTVGFTFR